MSGDPAPPVDPATPGRAPGPQSRGSPAGRRGRGGRHRYADGAPPAVARGQWQRAGAAADRSRRAVPGARTRGQGKPRVRTGERQRGLVSSSLRRPGEVRPPTVFRAYRASAGVAGSPRRGRPHMRQRRYRALGTARDPGERVSRRRLEPGRGCVHRRVPARGRRGPVVGGHANQSQVKGGCRHGQAWVMDPGRCGPDPGERVSVEGGALEPGSGRCTVDPGAQLDKDEHNRSGTRTLRLTSRVACGQVHRVWITGSSGSRSHLVTAAPGGSAPRDRALLSAL